MTSLSGRSQAQLYLFDHPIVSPSGERSLVSQVHEILIEEIRAGHWRVGERLPGVTTLAEQSGLSRSPLQRAFERLREEGYIRQEKGSGSFLISTCPDGVASFDTIGVALLLDDDTERLSPDHRVAGRLLTITEIALSHQRLLEVRYLRAEDDWSSLDRVGSVFGENVRGVISLHPFVHRNTSPVLEDDRLPFVHWGAASADCVPVVAADDENGYYGLTRRVIEADHCDIVFIADPDVTEGERAGCLRGHEQAMLDAGLNVDHEAIEASLALEEGDIAGIQSFLTDHRHATAVICSRYAISREVVTAAEMLGWRVPEDVSVAVAGHVLMRKSDPARRFCRLDYQRERMAALCFETLERQARTRRCEMSRVLLNIEVSGGESLAPPREGKLVSSSKKTNGGTR